LRGLTENEECEQDCNGDPGGPDGEPDTGDEAFFDDCGKCVGGDTGFIPNFIDTCLEDASNQEFNQENYPDVDCNCDCDGGAIFDDCGDCSGGLTGDGFNDNLDCSGICDGSSVIDIYCQDFDGDGLGLELSFTELCSVDIIEDCSGDNCFVSDCSDVDDNCNANLFGIDCAEVCESEVEYVGNVGDNGVAIFCFDGDGDGYGNPDDSIEICSAYIEEYTGYVQNCIDSDDENPCPSNQLD
jgi:hypothetical protein